MLHLILSNLLPIFIGIGICVIVFLLIRYSVHFLMFKEHSEKLKFISLFKAIKLFQQYIWVRSKKWNNSCFVYYIDEITFKRVCEFHADLIMFDGIYYLMTDPFSLLIFNLYVRNKIKKMKYEKPLNALDF